MLPESMNSQNKPLAAVVFLVLLLLSAFLVAKTWLAIREAQQVGQPIPYEYQISVEGVGEAKAVPDLARVTYMVETRGPSTEEAQNKNTSVGNTIIDRLTQEGVEKNNIKTTNYSSYQNFVYDEAGNQLPGGDWTTVQTVDVTLRDLAKVPSILTLLGQLGSTNISGPAFEVENQETAKDEARLLAIRDLKEKAQQIASELGLDLKEISSYSEYMDNPYYYGYDGKGAMAVSAPSATPTVAPGEQSIKLHVTAVYTLQSSRD